jgi:hypothetical protein
VETVAKPKRNVEYAQQNMLAVPTVEVASK